METAGIIIFAIGMLAASALFIGIIIRFFKKKRIKPMAKGLLIAFLCMIAGAFMAPNAAVEETAAEPTTRIITEIPMETDAGEQLITATPEPTAASKPEAASAPESKPTPAPISNPTPAPKPTSSPDRSVSNIPDSDEPSGSGSKSESNSTSGVSKANSGEASSNTGGGSSGGGRDSWDTGDDRSADSGYVWVCETGKKYHSHSGCSGMENPWQVSLEEAKGMGKTACKKCY